MTIYLLALLLGVVSGLRTMTALAAMSWAAYAGLLDLSGSRLAFLGYAWTPWILTGLALAELVADQLPSTPSRTVPVGFAGRLLSGVLAGAALSSLVGAGLAERWLVLWARSSARSAATLSGHDSRLGSGATVRPRSWKTR